MWFGHENALTAIQRRILITQWVDKAWEQLCGPEYEHLRSRCWQKTGCLMTADGSEDLYITPEGLPGYNIPPPLLYPQTADETPVPNPPETNETDTSEVEPLDGELEEPDDDGLKWDDKENDRCYDAPYCGQKMKVPYQNGWFIGDIDYFNNDFLMYRVSFSDGSDDYMDLPDDIDGVEVILL